MDSHRITLRNPRADVVGAGLGRCQEIQGGSAGAPLRNGAVSKRRFRFGDLVDKHLKFFDIHKFLYLPLIFATADGSPSQCVER